MHFSRTRYSPGFGRLLFHQVCLFLPLSALRVARNLKLVAWVSILLCLAHCCRVPTRFPSIQGTGGDKLPLFYLTGLRIDEVSFMERANPSRFLKQPGPWSHTFCRVVNDDHETEVNKSQLPCCEAFFCGGLRTLARQYATASSSPFVAKYASSCSHSPAFPDISYLQRLSVKLFDMRGNSFV